ncbi:MAG: hypothetical protein QOI78_7495, partial [Actinomycetota bacterium]|nr:hypothetical protein [Actinomycetota bacterium]
MAIRSWRAAAASLAVAGVVVGQQPAEASPGWAGDHFLVCPKVQGFHCDEVYVEGWITWGNRTATVRVNHRNAIGWVWLTGHFDAFAGSTKVDSHVSEDDETFVIGNPDLPGGINRIRSQACATG